MKCLLIASIAIITTFFPHTATAQDHEGTFEAPVLIPLGDKPLNHHGEILYPSPTIFDVDNDGKDELVIGTLFGHLYQCENAHEGKGDPQWTAPQLIETRMRRPLELNNW